MKPQLSVEKAEGQMIEILFTVSREVICLPYLTRSLRHAKVAFTANVDIANILQTGILLLHKNNT